MQTRIEKDGWTITGDTPADIELGVRALDSMQKTTPHSSRGVNVEMLSPREQIDCSPLEAPIEMPDHQI